MIQLDSDDLLAQFRKDWPAEYELSSLRWLAEVQDREIQRLTALTPQPFSPPVTGSGTYTSAASPRPYVLQTDDGEARHGG